MLNFLTPKSLPAALPELTAEPNILRQDVEQQASSEAFPVQEYRPPEIQVIHEQPQGARRVIGFFSGRGGVGKSTVALMVALSAQKRGFKTAVVDLDLQFGDISFLAGREPSSRIQRIALPQIFDKRELPELNDESLALVSAPDLPEQAESYVAMISWLLAELSIKRDLVIVNTGSFWSDVHAITIQSCTNIVLMMDQRATSIEACKQAMQLCLKLQAPQASLLHLLNGCGRGAAFTPQDVSLALGGFEVFGVADGGALVDELLSLGCPMELLGSGNAFILSLESVMDSLIGNPLSEGEGAKPKQQGARKTKLFDLGSFRRRFEGGQRVAT